MALVIAVALYIARWLRIGKAGEVPQMKRICQVFFCAVALLAGSVVGQTKTPSVDWKEYGGFNASELNFCFYEANGIMRLASDHLRVWTKCLRQKDLDSVDTETDHGKAIVEEAARKVARYYVPPIASLQPLTAQQALTVTLYEVTADLGSLQTQASIFYELDCPKRMYRELSIYIPSSGKGRSEDTPTEWQFVPPEGNVATLLRLLCAAQ
ncbi:hypothetical protein [Paraburkholderia sp. MM6662-R1]|uniref:hypothetical protein n=1 Tax=Paraburkholderia sp. MM6662-R1 TaxID=2991066 RepID=UPI003D1DA5B3